MVNQITIPTEARLFLGLRLNEASSNELNAIKPEILDLYINSANSLEKIEDNGMIYLGKFAENVTDVTKLELLSNNIISFLKKIFPTHTYNNQSLHLLSLLK